MICKSCNKPLLPESKVCHFCGLKINVDKKVQHGFNVFFHIKEKLKKLLKFSIMLIIFMVNSYIFFDSILVATPPKKEFDEPKIVDTQVSEKKEFYINFVDEFNIPIFPEKVSIYETEKDLLYSMYKSNKGYDINLLGPGTYRLCLTYSAEKKYYQSKLYEFVIDEKNKIQEENLFSEPIKLYEMQRVSRINHEQFFDFDTYDINVDLLNADNQFICNLPWDNEGYIYLSLENLPQRTYKIEGYFTDSDFYRNLIIEFEINKDNEASLPEEIFFNELQARVVREKNSDDEADVLISYTLSEVNLANIIGQVETDTIYISDLPDSTYFVSIEPVVQGVYEKVEPIKFTIKNGEIVGERRLKFKLIPLENKN